MEEKDLKKEKCGCKKNNNKDQDSFSQDIKKSDEKELKEERGGCKNNNNKDQDSCSQDIKKDDENCCETNCCKEENKVEMIEKDKYLRLFADFENYKRRTEEEKKNISIFVEQLIFTELIVIVDDFERFLNTETNADKKIVEGVSLILKKINSFLTKYEIKKINIQEGDVFNDEIAESISTQEVTDKNMENKIIKVYENGYNIKDKVLRFAKVIVGKLKE